MTERVDNTPVVHTTVNLCQWALERLHTPEKRLAFCEHMAGVFQRWAASERRALPPDPPKPEPKRTPSGTFAGVREALANATAPTRRVEVGQYLEEMAAVGKEKP